MNGEEYNDRIRKLLEKVEDEKTLRAAWAVLERYYSYEREAATMETSKMEFWRAEIILMVTQIMSEALVRRIYNHVSRIYALHNDRQQRKL